MDDSSPLLAIPVLRSRVAPVFNWCSRVHLFGGDGPGAVQYQAELDLGSLSALGRLETLRRLGVQTLICGALSPDLMVYGEQLGLSIIAGVAGEIEDVVQAFVRRELDQPRFWLPGCQGPRRYRGRCSMAGSASRSTGSSDGRPEPFMGGGDAGSAGSESPSSRRSRGGPGGVCVCPRCGGTMPHRRGIPCTQQHCPACRHSMVRRS
jgi:predicted Fe-Mo cluster-binding NifX family protein